MTDSEIHTLVDEIHAHLKATEELDINNKANISVCYSNVQCVSTSGGFFSV